MVEAKPKSQFLIAGLCFYLSGFAALIYQVVWLRQFGIYFGTSDQALAVVLSAYMGGLASGAYLAARYVYRVTRPILTYGFLELGIASSAMLVPVGLTTAGYIYLAVFGDQPAPQDAGGALQMLYYLISGFAVIMIPTALMGATLPILVRGLVKKDEDLGSDVGTLYVVNTTGAVCGTVFAAFVCMPALGMQQTVYIAVAVNVLVFLIAASYLGRPVDSQVERDVAEIEPEQKEQLQPKKKFKKGRRLAVQLSSGSETLCPDDRSWMLPIMFASGAVSFCYEILCTRMLGHLLGSSIFAFATMLSAFLTGIAIGGAIASRFAKTREQATTVFVITQLGVAIGAVLMYHSIESFAAISRTAVTLVSGVVTAACVMLPLTVFIGATFPLAIRVLSIDHRDASSASGRVFAWNTVGAIVGALLTGMFVLPLMHYPGTAKVAIACSLLIAAATCLLGKQRSMPVMGLFATAVLIFLVFPPQIPERLLYASPFGSHITFGALVHSEVGQSTTVTIHESDGHLLLRTGGLPEAVVNMRGALNLPEQEPQWLSDVPLLARPEAETMLVVGLGGGGVVESIGPSIKQVDVIELEPAVVRANEIMSPVRRIDPLQDRRIRICTNDARGAMSATSKRYDVVVSQPSHPWTAGASHLYTREFAVLVREHLRPEGVFLQWIDADFIDSSLLCSMAATLRDVFPWVRLYRPNQKTLLFLSSDSPIEPEFEQAESGSVLSKNRSHYASRGLRTHEDLIAILAVTHDDLAKMSDGATVITDNRNLFAMRGPLTSSKEVTADTFAMLDKWHPLCGNDPHWSERAEGFDLGWVARRRNLILEGVGTEAIERLEQEVARAESLARYYYRRGNIESAIQQLKAAVSIDSSSQNAIYMLSIIDDESARMHWQERLLGTAATAYVASGYCQSKSYEAVAKLDAELAAARPRDFWFELALQSRIQWRINDKSENRARRYAEAIDLCDQAAPHLQGVKVYSLRMLAALLLDRPIDGIGTCEHICHLIEESLQNESEMPSSQMVEIERLLMNCNQAMTPLSTVPRLQGYRLQSLIHRLQKNLAQVRALSS